MGYVYHLNSNYMITKVTEYADTAYKGKADPYYRENTAPPEQRKRHLAKGQCKLGVFHEYQLWELVGMQIRNLHIKTH